MKRALQITLPFLILVIAGLIVRHMILNKVEPQTRRIPTPNTQVVVRPLQEENFRVTLHSQGTVRARTESALIPEVRGRIVSISPNFQEGAFFEEGEVLLEIDDRDYRTELTVAEAALAQAELTLAQESARYEQAKRDWDRLNPNSEATSLTLREPQIRQARAAADSAKARVESARHNLERTKLTAPYAGRVLTKSADVGQFVSAGTQLAKVYAVDYAEVRLPLTANQYAFLNLPTVYRGGDPSIAKGPIVHLRSTVGGTTHSWEGRVVRSEGAVDTRTRQLFVVAQVENPYGRSVSGRPPLKVGTFVEAEIEGALLQNVIVIPRVVYRENSYVLVVDENNSLTRRPVNVVWEDEDNIVVRGGLTAGEQLCLTDVPYALESLPVTASIERKGPNGEVIVEAPKPRPTYADTVIERLGDKMPTDLKDQLSAAKESGDWSKIGSLMRQIDDWAKLNGIEMPPRS